MKKKLHLALETNGKGYLGFLCELPGAFVRGRTKEEALAKAEDEANRYLQWLDLDKITPFGFEISQVHQTSLMVEDADSEILLDTEKGPMSYAEFERYVELVRISGRATNSVYQNTQLKDWVDEDKIRKTFYGDTPKTIREIFAHINSVQNYYLSRIINRPPENNSDFFIRREICLKYITSRYKKENNNRVYEIDGECWTIKKVLRRFIWHDRIHAKSMIKILQKQKRLGLIPSFPDPFFFTDKINID